MAAQSTGAGTVWLMFSILASVASNYVLHLWVAHFLGADWYGTFGVIFSLYLINDAVLNVGIPRAVSKFISEKAEKFWSIAKTSFRIQLVLSLGFSLFYIFFADFLAALLKDQSLSGYILFLGIMVVPFSLTSLLLSGYLNGLRRFKEQALIKTIFPVTRTALAIFLVWLGLEMWGVLLAFFISILLAGGMSYYFVRKQGKKEEAAAPIKPLLRFALPLMLAVLAMALLRNVNVLFIKSMLDDNMAVAFYTAALTISNVSYLVFTALPLTITPAVSKALAEQKIILVRKYISSALRYALLLLLPLSAIVAATSSALLSWLYPASYAAAGPLLAILIFSSTFLVLFYVLLAVITAGGKPGMELFFSLFFLGLQVALNFLLIPRIGLSGSAYAQTLTSLIAMIGAAGFVFYQYRTWLPAISVARITLASAGMYLLALYWQYSGFLILVNYAGLGLLYLLLLFLFGELKKEDWNLVQRVLGRQR